MSQKTLLLMALPLNSTVLGVKVGRRPYRTHQLSFFRGVMIFASILFLDKDFTAQVAFFHSLPGNRNLHTGAQAG